MSLLNRLGRTIPSRNACWIPVKERTHYAFPPPPASTNLEEWEMGAVELTTENARNSEREGRFEQKIAASPPPAPRASRISATRKQSPSISPHLRKHARQPSHGPGEPKPTTQSRGSARQPRVVFRSRAKGAVNLCCGKAPQAELDSRPGRLRERSHSANWPCHWRAKDNTHFGQTSRPYQSNG